MSKKNTNKYREKHPLKSINQGEYGYFESISTKKFNTKNKKGSLFLRFDNGNQTQSNTYSHNPVMISDVLNHLKLAFDSYNNNVKIEQLIDTTQIKTQILNAYNKNLFIVIDATFGLGGYSKEILKFNQNIFLIAFDRDSDVLQYADEVKQMFPDRFIFINDKFSNITNYIPNNIVNFIVADFGISSMQVDNASRGFSFNKEALLDMRMDKNQVYTAFDVVNTLSHEDLSDIIYNLGGERQAKKIAKGICLYRETKQIKTTTDLTDIVLQSLNIENGFYKSKIHPATKTFQAIRIFVNKELEEIDELLEKSCKILINNGVFCCVSFHELEDGAVKRFVKKYSNKTKINKYHVFSLQDGDFVNHKEVDTNKINIQDISNGVVLVSKAESTLNPRARSAKMRCFKVFKVVK